MRCLSSLNKFSLILDDSDYFKIQMGATSARRDYLLGGLLNE